MNSTKNRVRPFRSVWTDAELRTLAVRASRQRRTVSRLVRLLLLNCAGGSTSDRRLQDMGDDGFLTLTLPAHRSNSPAVITDEMRGEAPVGQAIMKFRVGIRATIRDNDQSIIGVKRFQKGRQNDAAGCDAE